MPNAPTGGTSLAPEACDEGDLPPTADVAIVGSGYTALVAALHLARAGRSVLVLEADLAGHGAARRNAGYLGRTLKRSFTWLPTPAPAESTWKMPATSVTNSTVAKRSSDGSGCVTN